MTNNNIPYFQALVRAEIVSHETGLLECEVFGVKSVKDFPLSFHIMLKSGAQYNNIPISALVWNENYEKLSDNEGERLSYLSVWDCQSNHCEAIIYTYLLNAECDFKSGNGNIYRGRYMFTVENLPGYEVPFGYAMDTDVKCYHILQLDNGNFAGAPNTSLRWYNKAFIDRSLPVPRLKGNSVDFKSEFIPVGLQGENPRTSP